MFLKHLKSSLLLCFYSIYRDAKVAGYFFDGLVLEIKHLENLAASWRQDGEKGIQLIVGFCFNEFFKYGAFKITLMLLEYFGELLLAFFFP